MLAFLELRDLLLVALRAGFRSRNFGLGSVCGAGVGIAVARIATNARFAVVALLPIGSDVWSLFRVAVNARISAACSMGY
jgi:hypothetical protein